jgi:hypothetical protein
MVKRDFELVLIIALLFLNACGSTQIVRRTVAVPERTDINGEFPEAVYIKTRTQTFNSYHYYILDDGLIWYKSIDKHKEPKNWTLFRNRGLPYIRLGLKF